MARGKKSFSKSRPGSVFKVWEQRPPDHTLLSSGAGHPDFPTDERLLPAPAGLFSEKLKEGPDALLPGSIVKVYGDSKSLPNYDAKSKTNISSAAPSTFGERARREPSSLLPGSVIRVY